MVPISLSSESSVVSDLDSECSSKTLSIAESVFATINDNFEYDPPRNIGFSPKMVPAVEQHGTISLVSLVHADPIIIGENASCSANWCFSALRKVCDLPPPEKTLQSSQETQSTVTPFVHHNAASADSETLAEDECGSRDEICEQDEFEPVESPLFRAIVCFTAKPTWGILGTVQEFQPVSPKASISGNLEILSSEPNLS